MNIEMGNLEANCRFLAQSGLLRPGVRVLEIGSGRGSMLKWLLDAGADARGVEIDPALIAEGQAVHGQLPITPVAGVTLPFPDATVDVVVSFDVFEHIAESDAHLAEVRRVLVPGGWYLLQTPNKWTNTVFETIRWRSLTAWRSIHCALHTAAQVERRFTRHGFSVNFDDIPVVTDYFIEKVRRHLGGIGVLALRVFNPDHLPRRWRTNFYVRAQRRG
jgi:cyclopropane fatty-acyl-phospholipid synthase-like methyltransferase